MEWKIKSFFHLIRIINDLEVIKKRCSCLDHSSCRTMSNYETNIKCMSVYGTGYSFYRTNKKSAKEG